MNRKSVTLAFVGSGGSGVMTAGQMLFDAAARAGWYAHNSRSSGPQIRGGEAASFLTFSPLPVDCPGDRFDLIVAFDWQNVERFVDELPMAPDGVILTDPSQAEVPPALLADGVRVLELPLKQLADAVKGGRANMVGLGAVGAIIGLPAADAEAVIGALLAKKGEAAIAAAIAGAASGAEAVAGFDLGLELEPAREKRGERWSLSGCEGLAFGALKGGVRFCAAYPITPATELLEWLAPRLPGLGGQLVQAEDEIASINMCIGASFGGVPSFTATSGPGLSLMIEALGLAVGSETPVVVADVMRGGPSTGIPTKSEQADLNIAVYGMHGDAPHLVVAPTSIADSVLTGQWAVHLAEALQTPCLVLSDQAMGQARVLADPPPPASYRAERLLAQIDGEVPYRRYADTDSGISPAAIPGMAGGEHTAEGLEHGESALPSAGAPDHRRQLDKRLRKLMQYDFGEHWAEIDGDGEFAVLTWGSVSAPARAAVARLREEGQKVRLVAMRLISPLQPEKLASALEGVRKLLVLEQSHGAQFHKYLRAHVDLPQDTVVFHRPGPLPIRAGEVYDRIAECV